jgi:hypothetical protein
LAEARCLLRPLARLDNLLVALLAYARVADLNVKRQGVVARGQKPARLWGGVIVVVAVRCTCRRVAQPQEVHFVGEADAGQRAAGTLGAVEKGRWDGRAGHRATHVSQERQRPRAQLWREFDRHAGARADEVQDSLTSGVSVLFENQRLGAELNALGLPGAARHVGRFAPLVVDRRHDRAGGLHEVDPGHEAELLC